MGLRTESFHALTPTTYFQCAQLSCEVTWKGLEISFWVIKFTPSLCLPVIFTLFSNKLFRFSPYALLLPKLLQIHIPFRISHLFPLLLGRGMKENQNKKYRKSNCSLSHGVGAIPIINAGWVENGSESTPDLWVLIDEKLEMPSTACPESSTISWAASKQV